MAEYGFKCTECKSRKYVTYKMSEVPKERECENCGGVMERFYNPKDYQVNVPHDFHDTSAFNYDQRPSGRKSHVIKDNPIKT